MDIFKVTYYEGVDNLISKIRKTRLMNSDIEVYKNSKIELRSFFPFHLVPCQTYILFKQVDILTKINHESNKQCGISLNKLEGYLEIETDKGITTLTPPIVERDVDYLKHIIINDGMHRVYWAFENRIDSINCVYVENPSHPYYAYPVQGNWECVEELEDTIPDDFIKKYHRIQDYKSLYRDFNTAFKHHVGKPRGRGKQ